VVNTDNTLDKLVLGTAQLGLNYGINNTLGQPDLDVSRKLIECCELNGARYLDTARGYGNSEEVIGGILGDSKKTELKIITKLNLSYEATELVSSVEAKKLVDIHIQHSLKALQQKKLYSVLLHRASDLTSFSGSIWARLLEIKQNNLIEKLGVSVQSPEELELALKYEQVKYIQLPFNILDSRWANAIKYIQQAKSERNIQIHIRSIFLQGLLLSKNDSMWSKANCMNSDVVTSWLRLKVEQHNRDSIADLCLAYVRSLAWVDGIVIGMESVEQLSENIRLFNNCYLSSGEVLDIDSSRPRLLEETLNPARWKV
jgi:aryl-alcohol dehydrogenase-like predicted oxidoreductase